jgi:2-polyprenyl-6-methoxyphenol hydroxylase-like FAD-dependent oxidoreductase
LTNWAVCVQLAQPGTTPPRREDWSRSGRLDDLEPHLGRFTIEHLDLHNLVAATPQFYEYPMCDRDPLPAWGHGRVTLLGDAAHPMYPMGSNGATQAILDARCLARWLAAEADVATALRAYQDERMPPTTQIVHMNRTGGPEGIIDLVEERAPTGFEDIDDVISRSELEAVIERYTTVTGLTRN